MKHPWLCDQKKWKTLRSLCSRNYIVQRGKKYQNERDMIGNIVIQGYAQNGS